MSEIFRAKAVQIGSCGSPTCKNVHLQLLDANNEVRAVALIHCDEMWPVMLEMIDITTKMVERDMLSSFEPEGTIQ